MAAPIDKIFVREIERTDDKILKINQSEIGDVGCVVWDAALVLGAYLNTPDFMDKTGKHTISGRNVLELGAGTGVVGIQAACSGANVTITDLNDFIPLMELNINENKHNISGTIAAMKLEWGVDEEDFNPPDYLMMADCIYYDASLEPLVKTINHLSDNHTIVFCCYEERTTGNKPELQRKFFQMIGESFHTEEIPMERHDKLYRSEDIHIMKFTKR